MDEKIKEKILSNFKSCKLKITVGEWAEEKIPQAHYKKHRRKLSYLIRRGDRAKLQMEQFRSIPFLAKEFRLN